MHQHKDCLGFGVPLVPAPHPQPPTTNQPLYQLTGLVQTELSIQFPGLLQQVLDDVFTTSDPFFTILHGIGEIFITRDTKNATFFELFGKWNDCKKEEIGRVE